SLSNTTREALRGFMVLQWSTTRGGKCLPNSDAGGVRQDRDSGPENDIGSALPRPSRGADRAVGSDMAGGAAAAAGGGASAESGEGAAGAEGAVRRRWNR